MHNGMGNGKTTSAIAQNIRRLRVGAGLTQRALVELTDGVSIATLKNLERGSNTNPETATLQSVARTLGVKVSDLFRESRRKRGA